MHLIIYTQYYPPEIGAPQARLHELAVELARQGIQVTVLTAMPNYPHGRIFDGYRGWLMAELRDGVQVFRTAIFPTQSAGMLPRLLNYFSFIFSSLLIGSWRIKQADFVLTESPPLFLGLAGLLLSRSKKARWIFNISDLWPESVVELGLLDKQSWGYKLSSILEEFLYKKAWVVSGQSRTILENIRKRFPGIRTYHLANGVNTTFFRPNGAKPNEQDYRIFYAGLHGLAQGLEQIIFAAHKISPADGIVFTLIGDGPEKKQLVKKVEDLGLEAVNFLSPVPKEEMPKILQAADAIIVPLKVQLTGAVPSKLYEAMAMGKPVILIAASEAAQIVTDSKCGIVIPPGDVDGLVTAIRYLKTHPVESDQMGRNGRDAAVLNHDRKRISEDFIRFLISEQSHS